MPPMPPSLAGSWVGDAYNGYANDGTVARVHELLDIAIAFREQRKVPIFLGELGILMNNSDPEDRVYWYQVVREYLDANDISWTSWDYHGGFGLFNQGSPGKYEHDLNVPLLQALGFAVPPQTPATAAGDSSGFVIYADATAGDIAQSSFTSGALDMASAEHPHDGNACIRWANAGQYQNVGFDFQPDRDLSFLSASGYQLDFMVRGDTPGTRFDVRFLDTDTTDPDDHPWRMQVTIDDALVSWDGQWHRVQIPLADLNDQGAWDNDTWYPPQGAFDWSAVDRLEIVSETASLRGRQLWFDNIQLSKLAPGPAPLVNDVAANGLFYDPANPGHGFDFNVFPSGLTVFYYGHSAAGDRLWLISETHPGKLYFQQPLALEFFEIADGYFGAPHPPTTPWGDITITLADCNSGHAELDGKDGLVAMDLVRLGGLAAASCTLGSP
jgi:hypothetical protein